MNILESFCACDMLHCKDFYRYVLNSMSCHSSCFADTCVCDCNTNEIPIPASKPDDAEIALAALEICCDSTRLTHYSSSQGTLLRSLSENSMTKLEL